MRCMMASFGSESFYVVSNNCMTQNAANGKNSLQYLARAQYESVNWNHQKESSHENWFSYRCIQFRLLVL